MSREVMYQRLPLPDLPHASSPLLEVDGQLEIGLHDAVAVIHENLRDRLGEMSATSASGVVVVIFGRDAPLWRHQMEHIGKTGPIDIRCRKRPADEELATLL